MNKLYCVLCRKKTVNEGAIKTRTTKNGRNMAYCKCATCGCKKCSFLGGK